MKKISIAILFCSFIGLVSFKSASITKVSPANDINAVDDFEDYRFFVFAGTPVTDVPVTVYDARTGRAATIIVCPESGVTCKVKVTQGDTTYEATDEKGKLRGSIEVTQ